MLLATGESPGQEPDTNNAKAHGTNGSSQHDLGKCVCFHQTEVQLCIWDCACVSSDGNTQRCAVAHEAQATGSECFNSLSFNDRDWYRDSYNQL